MRTLPWDVVYVQPIKLLYDRCHMSIIGCSGLATVAWSSIMGDNVLPCIQLRIDTSTKWLCLLTMTFVIVFISTE